MNVIDLSLNPAMRLFLELNDFAFLRANFLQLEGQ